MTDIAQHLRIRGQVQGVGFRPFLYRLAQRYGLRGWVRNCGAEVELHLEGSAQQRAAYLAAIYQETPPLAQPQAPQISAARYRAYRDFRIQPSVHHATALPVIPPDYFVCADCLQEMQEVSARRYRYPFTNCTQCGPRYTIIDALPYDRAQTAMADFPLCAACQAEYANPADRRYHAQPLACPACGPVLQFQHGTAAPLLGTAVALDATINALRSGHLVAVKGIGGYHLLGDACCELVVQKLRHRKQRPSKPLAVLLPESALTNGWLERIATLTAAERAALTAPLRPIVLAQKAPSYPLAANVAPGVAQVGLLLPYSPLHHLLSAAFAAPLLATSANLSGEPVLTANAEVAQRLAHVADAFLHHNRPIRRPADDALVRYSAGRMRPLRLGRGNAPLELRLPLPLTQPTLAVGADLKNTIALAAGDRVLISPHLGDLATRRSMEVFEQVIADLQRLYAIVPQRIICDAHPDYFTTRWAQQQSLPLQTVFHHHAHANALCGEFALTDQLLVFTWDGLGYGADGNLWGGEALLGEVGNWQRVASLRPFPLLGGAAASREAWRCALALCWEAGVTWSPLECFEEWEPAEHYALLHHAWQRGLNCPLTSSIGRLFDAAAALLGLCAEQSYEGEAAQRLEAQSFSGGEVCVLPLQMQDGICYADWEPLLAMLRDAGRSVAQRAASFHASLAQMLVSQAQQVRREYGIERVGLSGGVFQNRCLTEMALAGLAQAGFQTYVPERLPLNDAAISFGQIVAAAQMAQVASG